MIDASSMRLPRWQAVGLVLDQNTRDRLTQRYGLLQEIVSWFKALSLSREAEFERMIERKPTPADKRYHKTWLSTLIADGERLVTKIRTTGGLPRNQAGIKLSDVQATVEELYDTQAEWHGGMKPDRKSELLKQILQAA